MAERRRSAAGSKKAEDKKREFIKVDYDNLQITRAYTFDNGDITFDMKYQGVCFYRLRVVHTQDDREFISFPAYQSNGKYYNYFYLALSDDDQEKIIDMVYDVTNED